MSKTTQTCVAAGLLLCLGAFTGCQAERAVQKTIEPDWSYRDGQAQFSNNAEWQRMLPTTAMRLDESQVASVEEPTR